MKSQIKIFIALLLSAVLLQPAAAVGDPRSVSAVEPPARERQVTILRKQVLANLIADAVRLDKIEASQLEEIREKRQELADGSYVLFLKVHDLQYKFKMSPEGKVISFGRTFEWWEIVLYGIGLVALGFAAGSAASK